MSDNTDDLNNIYLADYLGHSRKGKTPAKHNKAKVSKKIRQFKAKNNIGSDTWLSAYDVHKAKADKKRSHLQAKSVRAKGHDYKLFLQASESPRNENDFQHNLTQQDLDDYFQTEYDFYNWPGDYDWPDNYSDYVDDRSYSSQFEDNWSEWDHKDDTRSVCSFRTNRTNRTTRTLM